MRMPGTVITRRGRKGDGEQSASGGRRGDRPIGESYTGKDSQLDAAVKELLAQIGSK